jgi:RNA polymerase sigma-70 factor (ECF subfamily)
MAVDSVAEVGPMALDAETVGRVLHDGRLRVIAVAAAVVRDAHAAEDVFQQVVVSALEYRAQFRDETHALAWGLRAARFRALDEAKRRRLRCLSTEALDRIESAFAAQADDAWAERLTALRRCVEGLPDEVGDLLRMRYDRGLAVVAIAARLGRNADAVYQQLSRLHRALRACVRRGAAPDGPDEEGCRYAGGRSDSLPD